MNAAYKNTANRWNSNTAVRIETFAGQDRLVLTPLDKLEEPKSLKILRKRVQTLLPHTNLPELLLEINRWTGFADAFTHISQGSSRVNDLDISICAVLISNACNIGLEPVVQPGVPALEYDRLTWVEQQSVLKPREIMTDTAGYSDIIFGLFGLLGYQFSPRLADIGSARFWRLDSEADYGILNKLARNKIRQDIISRYWDDMLRVVGSLKLGTVNLTQLIQMLQRGGKPTMLGRAIGEFGRIYKTQYLLTYLDDPDYRRRILTQLNRGESRHSLARAVFYGKRGELHQSYREGQEDQLGALGLVVNAIVIWNTKYMEVALDAISQAGQPAFDSDVKRLSPLGYEHINIMGRYSFVLPEEIEQGGLRSLLSVDKIINDIGEGN
jgi:hypothetical protein